MTSQRSSGSAVIPLEDAARLLAERSTAPEKFTKIIVRID